MKFPWLLVGARTLRFPVWGGGSHAADAVLPGGRSLTTRAYMERESREETAVDNGRIRPQLKVYPR